MLLLLLYFHALAFIFWGCFLVHLFPLHLASLCVFISPFWSRAVVFSMARAPWWSCGALLGLAALGSVARRSSASPGSAPMCV